MFDIIIRTVSFALALAAGLALSTAYAIEAEAATFSGNHRVEVRELNPVCKGGDTVYRLRLLNDSAAPRSFWATSRWSKTVAPGGWASFRYRVAEDDPALDFVVTHRAEVLAQGVDRTNICG